MAAPFGHNIDAQRHHVQEETKKLNEALRGLRALRSLPDDLLDKSPDLMDVRADLEHREQDIRRSLERERAILNAMEGHSQPTREVV